jgi:hypothetical protein
MEMLERLVCINLEASLKEQLSDEAWLSGAVYSDSGNNKTYTDGITVGKEYKVTDSIKIGNHNDYVSIINDWGSERYYLSELFISKSEWRQNKLKELGIE